MTDAHSLSELREFQEKYVPNEETLTYMGQIALVALIAPTGGGKTTIADAMVREGKKKNEDWSHAGTSTTRERREGDPDSYVTADDGFTFDVALKEIKQGNLISWDIHPGGHIYAFQKEGLGTEFNVAPIMAQSYDAISQLALKSVSGLYLVTREEAFEEHLNERENDPKFQDRLTESSDSIEWYLRNSGRIKVVENVHGQPKETAQRALALLEREQFEFEREAGIEIALSMYNHIQDRRKTA